MFQTPGRPFSFPLRNYQIHFNVIFSWRHGRFHSFLVVISARFLLQ